MAGPFHVDVTTGNDGDDGLSEGNAWATLEKAADTLAAGELCHVKGSADYIVPDTGDVNCVMEITIAGTGGAPIVYRGYTDTPGDGGLVTINAGTNTLVSAIKTAINGSVYNVFENFRLTGGSGDGFDANGIADDYIQFNNVRFDNNSGWGFQGDNYHEFFKCAFDNNTAGGADPDNALYCGCIGHTNSGIALDQANHGAAFCVCYNNGGNRNIIVNINKPVLLTNNSIDGDNQGGSIGIFQDYATALGTLYINNILYDLAVGLQSDNAAQKSANPSDYNLFFSNTADRTNVETGDNDVVGSEPPFTNPVTGDYTLKAASEALEKGFDAGVIQDAASKMDIGAVQRVAGAGGLANPIMGGAIVR